MSLHRKKWNQKEKEEILLHEQEHGVSKTSREFNISTATYYSWKKKHDIMGEEGFVHGMTSGQLKRIRELEKENRLLKEIIVEKDLAGKLKDELLKKKYALEKKKHS